MSSAEEDIGSVNEEEKPKPPAKRFKSAGEARARRHHSGGPVKESGDGDGRGAAAAPIGDLDDALRLSISRYMDIYDWAELRRTCSPLRSWPKPSPPEFDYHLVRFCVSCSDEAVCGVAKTLNAVKDAYKHITRNDFDLRDWDDTRLVFQFVHLDGFDDEAAIPLIQYQEREALSCYDKVSCLHPRGERSFGLKNAARLLTDASMVKQMISNFVSVYDGKGGDGVDRWKDTCGDDGVDVSFFYHENIEDARDHANIKQHHDGLIFEDDDQIAPFVWLDGIKPLANIDLKHLVHKRGLDEDYTERGEETYYGDPWRNEIWLDKKTAKEFAPKTTWDFTFGPGDTWASCDEKTILWES